MVSDIDTAAIRARWSEAERRQVEKLVRDLAVVSHRTLDEINYLVDRVFAVEGDGVSNAADHGPTCADTPIDHRCGDTEADQGGTWREAVRDANRKLHIIADMHTQTEAGGGLTSGVCAECGTAWPCRTAHWANGWGPGEGLSPNDPDCYVTGWCVHTNTPVEAIYAGGPE